MTEYFRASCYTIFTTNMRGMYEDSSWGFDEEKKMQELRHNGARFLTVVNEGDINEKVLAFSHYRFEWDNDEEPSCPVLYVYEIHVSSEAQRYGIGRRLMTIMEMTALQCKMKKVILTVFKKNLSAMRFYRERMKYGVDESSPSCYGEEADYEILSKAMCRA
eukprot:CAMPEP_0113302658 /NCGR_PEP_ID=MMETSP0010_2-20120614/3393_1 /TAXON_ID=216773 ORGANISM="Corethron hystrix, Strain 308" /NCGR_SAMPLE_ID=MMETSP0010_2 /ASSEMBLY_ACC=CAM_ASM_000155 /LENGTH=161 /DNA_ID=CAMNT_0000156513 /DNA_START=124 /DNA_END=609 /DNA_ORIENTATION=+ /assembly_acc=CAM_ASM_000155